MDYAPNESGYNEELNTRRSGYLETFAFNAAYLAARLAQHPPESAARLAHQLASEVIMHPGAIIPRAAMPELNL